MKLTMTLPKHTPPPPKTFHLELSEEEAVYLRTVCFHVNSVGKIGKFFRNISDNLDAHDVYPNTNLIDKASGHDAIYFNP